MDAKVNKTMVPSSSSVSIHAPVMDANIYLGDDGHLTSVSIHAPVMDANAKAWAWNHYNEFQSTRP